jgi:hypothetical protein
VANVCKITECFALELVPEECFALELTPEECFSLCINDENIALLTCDIRFSGYQTLTGCLASITTATVSGATLTVTATGVTAPVVYSVVDETGAEIFGWQTSNEFDMDGQDVGNYYALVKDAYECSAYKTFEYEELDIVSEQSLSLAGNGYVNTGLSSDFGDTFSIFAYFTLDDLPSDGHYTVFGPFDSVASERMYVSVSEQGGDFVFGIGVGGSLTLVDVSVLKPEVDKKYFICAVVNKTAGTKKLYINGAEVVSDTFTGNVNSDTFFIGARNNEGTAGDFLNGDIDEVFILNKDVSLSEYNAFHRNLNAVSNSANLIHWWRFEDDVTAGTTKNEVTETNDTVINGTIGEALDTFFYEATFTLDELTVNSGQTFDIYGKAVINVSGDVLIEGTLNGDYNGHPRPALTSYIDGVGPGAGVGQSSDGGTGASYGGLAGTAPDAFSSVASVYGSETSQDIEKGSSGANGDNALGGEGGAGLFIDCEGNINISDTAVLSFNGRKGGDSLGSDIRGAGGGSGGGIALKAVDITILSGATLRCNGGIAGINADDPTDENNDNGGCGGGGRIKLFYSGTLTNNGTIEVNGGTITDVYASIDARADADNGTIHTEQI